MSKTNGKVHIGPFFIECELDTDDPRVVQACQRIFDKAAEQIEADIAHAVIQRIKIMLPGIKVNGNGIQWYGQEGDHES